MKNRIELIERKQQKQNAMVKEKVKKKKKKKIKKSMREFFKRRLNSEVQLKQATNVGEKIYQVELRIEKDKELIMGNR